MRLKTQRKGRKTIKLKRRSVMSEKALSIALQVLAAADTITIFTPSHDQPIWQAEADGADNQAQAFDSETMVLVLVDESNANELVSLALSN